MYSYKDFHLFFKFEFRIYLFIRLKSLEFWKVCSVKNCEKTLSFFAKINHFCQKLTRQSIFFHKMTHFSQISEFMTYFSKNFLMIFSMLQWRCLTMLNSYRVTHWESTCTLESVPATPRTIPLVATSFMCWNFAPLSLA